MRRILIAAAVCVLAGCANQPSTTPPPANTFKPKELLGDFRPGTQGANEGIVIVSLSALGQGIEGEVYGLTRIGEGGAVGGLTAYGPKTARDFQLVDTANNRNGGGRLLVMALPSGTYSFTGFVVRIQGRLYNTSSQYRPTFSVTPGSIVYLGNVHTTIAYSMQQNGFVYLMTSRDARERDFKLLRERYPFIDGARVAIALLPGNETKTPVSNANKSVGDAVSTNLDDLSGLMKH